MTVADQIKIMDRKSKQNEAQYDLDRKVAKISAFFSNNLDKYEYQTGENLDVKPSTVEQERFEYSPLGRVFNRGLKNEVKKEGLVKRVKNIEDKKEEVLKAIKDKTEIKLKIDLFDEDLTPEAIVLIKETKSIEENVDYEKLSFTGGNNKVYSLDSFKIFQKLTKDIRNKNMIIDEAEIKQNKFAEKLDELRTYPARRSKYIDLKEIVSKNVKNCYDGWEKIVYGFKDGILLLSKKDSTKTDSSDQTDILDTPEQKNLMIYFIRLEKNKNIDMILFKQIFDYDTLDKMLQILRGLQRVDSYNQKVFPIEDTIISFGDRVKKMSEGVDKNKGKEILKMVSKILDFGLSE